MMTKRNKRFRGFDEEQGNFYQKYKRFETRNRRIMFPLLAIVGVIIALAIDSGDWKWPIGIVVGMAILYSRASEREDGASSEERRV